MMSTCFVTRDHELPDYLEFSTFILFLFTRILTFHSRHHLPGESLQKFEIFIITLHMRNGCLETTFLELGILILQ